MLLAETTGEIDDAGPPSWQARPHCAPAMAPAAILGARPCAIAAPAANLKIPSKGEPQVVANADAQLFRGTVADPGKAVGPGSAAAGRTG